MAKVKKRDGTVEEFVQSKIVKGVRKAGATAQQATQVAKEVSAKIAGKTEVTAQQLSRHVVTSLGKVNKTAADDFVKFRNAKLRARKKEPKK